MLPTGILYQTVTFLVYTVSGRQNMVTSIHRLQSVFHAASQLRLKALFTAHPELFVTHWSFEVRIFDGTVDADSVLTV